MHEFWQHGGMETRDIQEEESNDHPGSKVDGDRINLLSRIIRGLVSIAHARTRDQEGSKG